MKYDWEGVETLLDRDSRRNFINKLKSHLLIPYLGMLTTLAFGALEIMELVSAIVGSIGISVGLGLIGLGLYLLLRKINSVRIWISPVELLKAAKAEKEKAEVAEEKMKLYMEECKRYDWVETKIPFYRWGWAKQSVLYTACLIIFAGLTFGVMTLFNYLPVPESGWYAQKLQKNGNSLFMDRMMIGGLFTFIGLAGLYLILRFVKAAQLNTEKIPLDEDEWPDLVQDLITDQIN